MIEYDDKTWKDDDYWEGAEDDVARDDEGHLKLSEGSSLIDVHWYQKGWTLVVGLGVLVALIVFIALMLAGR